MDIYGDVINFALALGTFALAIAAFRGNRLAQKEADANAKAHITLARPYLSASPRRLDLERVGVGQSERAIAIVAIRNNGRIPAADVRASMQVVGARSRDDVARGEFEIGYLAPGDEAHIHCVYHPGGKLHGAIDVTGEVTFRDELADSRPQLTFAHRYEVSMADWATNLHGSVAGERADRPLQKKDEP